MDSDRQVVIRGIKRTKGVCKMAKTLRQTHDETARELESVTDPEEQLEKTSGTRYGAAELASVTIGILLSFPDNLERNLNL